MNTTPSWEAAKNGRPGHLDATNHANHVNQLLGMHNITPVYEGSRIVRPAPGCDLVWTPMTNTVDIDQPLTMPTGSTAIGRVTLPLQATGAGADVLVTLYPDNAGSPSLSNPIVSTTIPASWITAFTAPQGLSSGGPLASPSFNVLTGTGGIAAQPWGGPVGDGTGIAQNVSVCVSGNYFIIAGGYTTTTVATVNTIPYLGGAQIGGGQPQPPLPVAAYQGHLIATSDAVVFSGGYTSIGSTWLTNTWVASWDPSTGTVGSWSSQAALPVGTYAGATAVWNDTVYIMGGLTSTGNVNTVYYATVTNGQLTSWNTGPPLPVSINCGIAGVVGNWLIIAGGNLTSSESSVNASAATYYAAIASDGSLGSWQTGPLLPSGVVSYGPGWDTVVTDSALVVFCGLVTGGLTSNLISTLTASTTGMADHWQSCQWREGGAELVGGFPVGNGEWCVVNPNIPVSEAYSTTLTPVSKLSVPLPAAGLTPGATYHVVIQQHQTASASDYVSYGIGADTPLSSGYPVALQSPRHGNSWTPIASGGTSHLPMTVYDTTVSGEIWHTLEDPSSTGSSVTSNLAARSTTLVWNQKNLPIGVAEATALPNDPLNSNPTFTSGTSTWTAHNGTIAQSSAQTHGGYAFSGLMTPTGGSSTASVTSELVPIKAVFPQFSNAQWYQVNGWFYSPTGWANVSLSVDWYDATSTYISTSSTPVSLTAATWTNLVNTYQPPSNAAYASIDVTEGSIPAATNLLYLSNVTLALSPELTTALGAVTQITYSGQWPPIGVTQLA